jgi:hypothetical protein
METQQFSHIVISTGINSCSRIGAKSLMLEFNDPKQTSSTVNGKPSLVVRNSQRLSHSKMGGSLASHRSREI